MRSCKWHRLHAAQPALPQRCLTCAADAAGNAAESTAAMTPAAVEKALDEVRPYLIADGGNVEVPGRPPLLVWAPVCSQSVFQWLRRPSVRLITSDDIMKLDARCTVQLWVSALGMHRPNCAAAGGGFEPDA